MATTRAPILYPLLENDNTLNGVWKEWFLNLTGPSGGTVDLSTIQSSLISLANRITALENTVSFEELSPRQETVIPGILIGYQFNGDS